MGGLFRAGGPEIEGRVLETVTRIQQLGGDPVRSDRVAEYRAQFEARTGSFVPEDPWFEERSRAFWCDALTEGRFGREVEDELSPADRIWLGPLERAHRGLFSGGWSSEGPTSGEPVLAGAGSARLVDAWSGAEFVITLLDEASAAELAAAGGQLFDARVVVSADASTVALLPGAVFHARDATAPIHAVLAAAHERGLGTNETLDALLRMQRTLRSLSRVKTAYAYRPEALQRAAPSPARDPHEAANRMRRTAKAPT
jgi:hypothetical protein